jgi:glutathione peroxidase
MSETSAAAKILSFTLPANDGNPLPLASFQGKVMLLVNVASQCGLTPQYEALQTLYENYKEQGFVVLGFPANDFGAQEPGSNEEIKRFCVSNYSVNFPLFAKVSVKGPEQTPLYQFLTQQTPAPIAGEIQWNFTKFLVDRDGNVTQRFEPGVTPDSAELIGAIENLVIQ